MKEDSFSISTSEIHVCNGKPKKRNLHASQIMMSQWDWDDTSPHGVQWVRGDEEEVNRDLWLDLAVDFIVRYFPKYARRWIEMMYEKEHLYPSEMWIKALRITRDKGADSFSYVMAVMRNMKTRRGEKKEVEEKPMSEEEKTAASVAAQAKADRFAGMVKK